MESLTGCEKNHIHLSIKELEEHRVKLSKEILNVLTNHVEKNLDKSKNCSHDFDVIVLNTVITLAGVTIDKISNKNTETALQIYHGMISLIMEKCCLKDNAAIEVQLEKVPEKNKVH